MVYAVPGVPYEMADMFERAIGPDLERRMADRGEASGTIVSRVVRTWGMSESGLAETLGPYIDGLDEAAAADGTGATATIAFLASGIEGIKVRVTVRSADEAAGVAALDVHEAAIRAVLADAAGDVVFGVDDEAIEDAVAGALATRRLAPRAWPSRSPGVWPPRGSSTCPAPAPGSGARSSATPPR